MTAKQNTFYWRLWGQVRKARPGQDRKDLHAQPSEHWPKGLPASHTEWRNAEMDEWVARCAAITRPESFTTQIRQVRMPQTRWLTAIDHALFALLKERDYAEGIARQMNLRGKMGGPFTTLETLTEEGLEKVFIALKLECRREWPLKEHLLHVVLTAIQENGCDEAAIRESVLRALCWTRLPPLKKLTYEHLVLVLSVLHRVSFQPDVEIEAEPLSEVAIGDPF